MKDLATMVAVRGDSFRQGGNLEIAKREGMVLNAHVDLPGSQTSHPKLQVSAGRTKP